MAQIGIFIIMAFLLNDVLGQNCGRNCQEEDEENGGDVGSILSIIGGAAFLICVGSIILYCCGKQNKVIEDISTENSQVVETSITIESLPYNPSYYGDAPVAPIIANAPVEDDLPSYDEVTSGNYR